MVAALIQRGGGTGPTKPSNRLSARFFADGAVLIPPERESFWKMRG